MAEGNARDLPASTGRSEASIFFSEPRSFKMDRRSPEAAALREAISRKLLEFLGTYTDDVLTLPKAKEAKKIYRNDPFVCRDSLKFILRVMENRRCTKKEYIIVLVCNGKHQNQARDDLEAFLGSESEKFIAWLWDHLSIQFNVLKPPLDSLDAKSKAEDGSCDPSNIKKKSSYSNNIKDLERRKDPVASETLSIQAHVDRSQEQACAVYGKVCVTNSNQSGSKTCADASLMPSTKTFSGDEQWIQSCNQQQKNQQIAKSNSSALPCQPLYVLKTEPVARNLQSIIRDDIKPQPLTSRSAVPSRTSANDDDIVEAHITRPRGTVWDRLGKPCKDNEGVFKGEMNHPRKTERINHHIQEIQDPKSVVAEPYAQVIGNKMENVTASDKGHKRRISNNYPKGHNVKEHIKQGSFEHVVNLKKMKHGDSSPFCGSEENILHDKEAFQKTKELLTNKYQFLPRRNELTTGGQSETGKLAEQTCTSVKSLSEQKAESGKVVQFALNKNTSETTMMQNSVPSSSSSKPNPMTSASGNSESEPVQNEMLDVKLKLLQVEKDMQKLRSKQAHLSNSKPMQPSGLQVNSKEDVESRTVLVTNVHFAASREALLSHFTKCGPIVKATMLIDTLTGQPKGEAYVLFSNKESVDKAISLSGTSFYSRILTVTRKTEPSGPPTQPATKIPHPRLPQLQKKLAAQRQYTSPHLQWKREESASKQNITSASTKRLDSSSP